MKQNVLTISYGTACTYSLKLCNRQVLSVTQLLMQPKDCYIFVADFIQRNYKCKYTDISYLK